MNMKTLLLILNIFLLIVLSGKYSFAQETISFSSGNKKVQLIELYSSQGCSSCPPAENWLNKFEDDKRLWKEIVPLGFHVDYWDRLGWKDPFGSREFTLRQYAHKKTNNVGSVYTPGFVVDGSEWRGWFRGGSIPNINEKAGELKGKLVNNTLEVEYSEKYSKLELNYAILGFDLKTEITRGENRGKTLTHDFVVLSHIRSVAEDGKWELKLPSLSTKDKSEKYAIAIWVNKPGDLDPIQATGAWISKDFIKTASK